MLHEAVRVVVCTAIHARSTRQLLPQRRAGVRQPEVHVAVRSNRFEQGPFTAGDARVTEE